jgi:alpha-mannosidase II
MLLERLSRFCILTYFRLFIVGIFQHHDGITGTAKTAVVNDYGIKLVKSIQNSQYVIQKSIETMVQTNPSEKDDNFLIIDDERLNSESLLIKKVLLLDDEHKERKIYIFNPSEHKRPNEIVSVYINTKSFQIHDESNGVLIKDYQLNLLWTRQQSYTAYVEHSTDTFEVLFPLKVINQFEIREIKFVLKTEQDQRPSQVKFYLPEKSLHINKIDKIIDYEVLTENSNDMVDVDLFDSNLKAKFSKKTGLLQEITDTNSDKHKFKTQVKFKSYGVTNAREKSGAYLFLPDSAKSTELNYILKWYRIELGKLRIRVCSHLLYVVHCVEFFSFDFENNEEKMQPRFGIWNLVDIQLQNNFEFVMNLNSDVENTEREFYTDLNGYQYIKRKTFDKLPVQANVYPMPSAVYIQDESQRLSVISAQPLGVDCLVKSEIEIFLDRRLNQDDNRGLEQPILDNKLTSSRFFVLFERRSQTKYEKNSIHPSLTVQLKSFDLSNPLLILFLKSTLHSNPNLNLISPEFELPCDLKLINMRTLHENSNEEVTNTIGFIFHRLAYDCSFDSDVCKSTNSLRTFSNFFNPSKNFKIKNLTNSHLTMTKDKHVFNDYSFDLMDFIKPNEIESFKLSF